MLTTSTINTGVWITSRPFSLIWSIGTSPTATWDMHRAAHTAPVRRGSNRQWRVTADAQCSGQANDHNEYFQWNEGGRTRTTTFASERVDKIDGGSADIDALPSPRS